MTFDLVTVDDEGSPDDYHRICRINQTYAPFPILPLHRFYLIIRPMSDLARTPAQIGNSIRRVRKALGWSQSELGSRAGLRQETISLIETGNPATRIDTLLAVIGALDLELRLAPRSKGTAASIEDAF